MAKDNKDAKDDNESEQTEAPKSRKKLFILIGIGLFAVLLSIGGATFMLLRGGDEDKAASSEPATPQRQIAIYHPLDPAFVVNYQHAGRQRFMQVSVVLLGRDPVKMQKLAVHNPLLRNQLVMLFSSEDFTSLQSIDGKEALRARATMTVQALLEKEIGDPVIESVLFTNLVLQ